MTINTKWKANGVIVADQYGNYISTAANDMAAKLFADAHNDIVVTIQSLANIVAQQRQCIQNMEDAD